MNTKYNWFRVPKDVTHIATDKNLSIYGYYSEPKTNEEFECWSISSYKHSPCYLGKSNETDWRNSLEERPSFAVIIDTIENAIKNTPLTEIVNDKNEKTFNMVTSICAYQILKEIFK